MCTYKHAKNMSKMSTVILFKLLEKFFYLLISTFISRLCFWRLFLRAAYCRAIACTTLNNQVSKNVILSKKKMSGRLYSWLNFITHGRGGLGGREVKGWNTGAGQHWKFAILIQRLCFSNTSADCLWSAPIKAWSSALTQNSQLSFSVGSEMCLFFPNPH